MENMWRKQTLVRFFFLQAINGNKAIFGEDVTLYLRNSCEKIVVVL